MESQTAIFAAPIQEFAFSIGENPARGTAKEPTPHDQCLSLEQYELSTAIGSGPDGIAYNAINRRTNQAAEVHLVVAASQSPHRIDEIKARSMLVALLEHPVSQPLVANGIERSPPFLAFGKASLSSLAQASALRALPEQVSLRFAAQLCSCLVDAHKLGLVHGNLNPDTVHVEGGYFPVTCFAGLNTCRPASADTWTEFVAPEFKIGHSLDSSADIFSFARLLVWLMLGDAVGDQVAIHFENAGRHGAAMHQLLSRAAASDPADRPTAVELDEVFRRLLSTGKQSDAVGPAFAVGGECDKTGEIGVLLNQITPCVDKTGELEIHADLPMMSTPQRRLVEGATLGRYRLLNKLGEGGMGAVYKAEDQSTGAIVAIKVLNAIAAMKSTSLRRFQKEARLLASVNNPYVTNLIEVNEENGLHYMVLEFVEGIDLRKKLAKSGPLDESQVLAIAADVARALVDAHQRGIVHRDIKPENILLSTAAEDAATPTIKLSDFGIARHVDQSESLAVTQAGSLIGTPLYMSPEQCKGGAEITPQSDVYALGVTMFELLAGRTPFQANDPMKLAAMHCFDAPPALRALNGRISDRTIAIVERSLAKFPSDRFADAGQLLREIDHLLRGDPATIALHPALPKAGARQAVVGEYVLELKCTPEQLWPYVSNTERLNRAIGLPPAEFFNREVPERGVVRFGKIKIGFLAVEWEEHPFEWIEGRRMGVLREFVSGPFQTFVSVVELKRRADGGTNLTHRITFVPRNIAGRMMAGVQTRWKAKRALEAVYRRIDATLSDAHAIATNVDPFEPAAALSIIGQARLDERVEKLKKRGVTVQLAEQLAEFVATATSQEVARIRPLDLADRLRHEQNEVLDACLHAVAVGMLKLQWDILCPTCRIASDTQSTLREIAKHSYCQACNLDFNLDLANSVELIFRAHPDLRDVETGTFCVGGPGHSPHVVSQLRLAIDERMELELSLPIGEYILRGPQFAQTMTIRVQASGAPSHSEILLGQLATTKFVPTLRAGSQLLTVTNDTTQPLLVRLERTIPRSNVITAAQASTTSLFRELFPDEILGSGQLMSAEQVTLLVTNIDDVDTLYERSSDAAAFKLIQQVTELIGREVRLGRGAMVKTVGESVVAAFDDPTDAVQTALTLQHQIDTELEDARVRINAGVHRGPALVTTVNDRLDYFGSTARIALALPQYATGGTLLLSQDVTTDPAVADLLAARGIRGALKQFDLPGRPDQLVQFVQLS